MVTERPYLRARTRSVFRAQAQFLHQSVGGSRQENPKLIRPEAGATGAVNGESQVQFLDPVLDIASRTIDSFIDKPGRLPKIGNDEARVVLGFAAGIPQNFSLHNNASLVRPCAGSITALSIDALGLVAFPRKPPSRSHESVGSAPQDGVFGHRDHVINSGLFVEEVEDVRCGKAGVEADQDARSGEGFAQTFDQTV